MTLPVWSFLLLAVSGSVLANHQQRPPALEVWPDGDDWLADRTKNEGNGLGMDEWLDESYITPDDESGREKHDWLDDDDYRNIDKEIGRGWYDGLDETYYKRIDNEERRELKEWLDKENYETIIDKERGNEKTVSRQDSQEWDKVFHRMLITAKHKAKAEKLTAKEIVAKMTVDGAFEDLKANYGQLKDTSNAYMIHGKRLAKLLLIYDYGKADQSDVTLDDIEKGFEYLIKAPINLDTNWWSHVIGVPHALYPSALLAKGVISNTILISYVDRHWLNTEAGPVWNLTDKTGSMAGGNLASRATVAEVEGVLRGPIFREERHKSVGSELDRDLGQMKPYGGNGLRPDGCLHQHNLSPLTIKNQVLLDHRLYLIYNGAYGRELLKQVVQLFEWYTFTSLEYRKDTRKQVFRAFFECHQWLFRHKTFEPTSCGRKLTKGKVISSWGADFGVYRVAKKLQSVYLADLGLSKNEQELYQQTLKNITLRFKTKLHRGQSEPSYGLNGHRVLYSSDLTVHHRPGYMASVRVLSYRTCRPETWTTANYLGYYQGDGWVTIYTDGKEYGSPNAEVFLVYDWNLIPGVTNTYVTHDKHFPKYKNHAKVADHFYNKAKFVGGVTNGQVGVTTMDYDRSTVNITALKSYFFFDECVVVMGTRIQKREEHKTTSMERVQTTLAQMVFDEAVNARAIIGTNKGGQFNMDFLTTAANVTQPQYLHHRDIGYVFLKGVEKLVVYTKAKKNPKKTDVFINMFYALVDHGQLHNPTSLAYVIYPNKNLQQTQKLATDTEINIMVDEDHIHVVCHKNKDESTYIIGAVMFQADQSWSQPCFQSKKFSLYSSQPILALIKFTVVESTVKLSLWLTDPTQLLISISYKLHYDEKLIMKGELELPSGDSAGKTSSEITVKL